MKHAWFVFVLSLPLSLFAGPDTLEPVWDGKDTERERIAVKLTQWVAGLQEPTDLVAVPGEKKRFFLLEKGGTLSWFAAATPNNRKKLVQLAVRTSSEQGLLGIALHPKFATNRRIYLNYTPAQGSRRTRISEWTVSKNWGEVSGERVLLEIDQPYPNHNAGQLAFGPDGMLYIGTGDGGFAGDPKNHAQNPGSLLGKMLRVDVNAQPKGASKPYVVPADNPFANKSGYQPEIWALGLRNPWRYTVDPSGRLIVADVGQNLWEEVSIVEKGKNYGWRVMEASQCYSPKTGCQAQGLELPWLEYGREDGGSITGGLVYAGTKIPALQDKYLFADFVSGRLWAAPVPKEGATLETTQVFSALGRYPIDISAFAVDHEGELIVAAFTQGALFRIRSGE